MEEETIQRRHEVDVCIHFANRVLEEWSKMQIHRVIDSVPPGPQSAAAKELLETARRNLMEFRDILGGLKEVDERLGV